MSREVWSHWSESPRTHAPPCGHTSHFRWAAAESRQIIEKYKKVAASPSSVSNKSSESRIWLLFISESRPAAGQTGWEAETKGEEQGSELFAISAEPCLIWSVWTPVADKAHGDGSWILSHAHGGPQSCDLTKHLHPFYFSLPNIIFFNVGL